ncbi:unnamed protein product [Chondrus crispus]|uniref:Uncharacterized protein n=1 Tax=Chondrus crispus TaxID=2769 RepID=R7QK88_CHOCR|nr:unnamed protein product [Chondrus crispus]CDF37820.1 unnamed protein product [Chondrus crispus]|eukprot:XP_005717691.1 unnamed protein product [Chondrus crispus]
MTKFEAVRIASVLVSSLPVCSGRTSIALDADENISFASGHPGQPVQHAYLHPSFTHNRRICSPCAAAYTNTEPLTQVCKQAFLIFITPVL